MIDMDMTKTPIMEAAEAFMEAENRTILCPDDVTIVTQKSGPMRFVTVYRAGKSRNVVLCWWPNNSIFTVAPGKLAEFGILELGNRILQAFPDLQFPDNPDATSLSLTDATSLSLTDPGQGLVVVDEEGAGYGRTVFSEVGSSGIVVIRSVPVGKMVAPGDR